MSNGDRHVQTFEDAEAEQRARLLFSVSDSSRFEVHSLCKCAAPRLKTKQPSAEHHLWPQGNHLKLINCYYQNKISSLIAVWADMRFWACANCWSRTWPHRILHRIRSNSMVSSARDYAELKGKQRLCLLCASLPLCLRLTYNSLLLYIMHRSLSYHSVGLFEGNRLVVSWLHSCWNALQQTALPGKALLGPTEPNSWCLWIA